MRALIKVIAACSVALISVIAISLMSDSYVRLYSYIDIDPAEAAETVELLAAQGIKYKLGADGTTILVPDAEKPQIVTSLAIQGFPRYANEYLNNANRADVSEADKKIWMRLHAEETLSAALMTNPVIADAHVDIAEGSGELFETETLPVTASVYLKLTEELTEDDIDSIIKLISSSWADLAPENVWVVDQHMNLLSPAVAGQADDIVEIEQINS